MLKQNAFRRTDFQLLPCTWCPLQDPSTTLVLVRDTPSSSAENYSHSYRGNPQRNIFSLPPPLPLHSATQGTYKPHSTFSDGRKKGGGERGSVYSEGEIGGGKGGKKASSSVSFLAALAATYKGRRTLRRRTEGRKKRGMGSDHSCTYVRG